jgi:hypothetical protein
VETAEANQTGGALAVDVSCPSGVATGGGASVSPHALAGVALVESRPIGDPPTAWHAEAEQVSGSPVPYTLTAYVICGQ